MSDIVGKIIAYENGELGFDETVEFVQELIDTGTIRGLQGSYQRLANALVDEGYCHE